VPLNCLSTNVSLQLLTTVCLHQPVSLFASHQRGTVNENIPHTDHRKRPNYLRNVYTEHGADPASYPVNTESSLLFALDAVNSNPSSAKVKKEWVSTSTPHTFLRGLYKGSFIFYSSSDTT